MILELLWVETQGQCNSLTTDLLGKLNLIQFRGIFKFAFKLALLIRNIPSRSNVFVHSNNVSKVDVIFYQKIMMNEVI